MKLFCTSDTHGKHKEIEKWLPAPGECDVFVFAGDFTARESRLEIVPFVAWLCSLKDRFKHIIQIAGNHDACFDMPNGEGYYPYVEHVRYSGIHYLQDSGCEIDGVHFWGSPWTPPFMNWSFMAEEKELKEKYGKMPIETQVLITHGPPFGYLDQNAQGEHCGSTELSNVALSLSIFKLKHHIFGHIHESHGVKGFNYTVQLSNVSACDGNYNIVNKPIIIEA